MSQMPTSPIKILIIEDEIEIGQFLEIVLKKNGYDTTVVRDGLSAQKAIREKSFGLILLDWMLPEMNGIEILREMRKNQNQTPVIFITAKTQPHDVVLGLEAGADDYLTKPFDNSVLLARIDSVLRRYNIQSSKQDRHFSKLKFRSITMNLDTYEVNVDQQILHLTKSEFVILSELIKNCEKVLTRDQLVEKTQGGGVIVTSRTIDTHVFGLRKKLADNGDWIETIRGVGYRLISE